MSTGNHLFSRYGVELEYMLVDRESLEVAAVADRLLHDGDERKNERRWGDLRISNELVLHVLEFKTDGPERQLEGLAAKFQKGIREVNAHLADDGVCLMPGAMHPWMDPEKDARLWPHGNRAVYEAFDRLFDCRGHGWSNLQSTHLNLPFADEREFVRLHEALRWVMPLVPALAASSPFLEGRAGGSLDQRLTAYRDNCRRLSSITARVLPEGVGSIAEYHEVILGRIAEDLRPHDAAGILEPEWVNARGAIARFSRGTIELRVMDVQECPAADLAILQFIVAILRELTEGEGGERLARAGLETAALADLFDRAVAVGLEAEVEETAWLGVMDLAPPAHRTLGEVAAALFARYGGGVEEGANLEAILREGNLATRLLRAAGPAPARERLREVYREMAACLDAGRMFGANS
jgi:glutamate---cysteine ligase / carboxylate-amine ligase